jgi:hypothetical protein
MNTIWHQRNYQYDPDPMHISQLAFYYHCTKRKPFLFYVNENEYTIFDDMHDMLRNDYLE